MPQIPTNWDLGSIAILTKSKLTWKEKLNLEDYIPAHLFILMKKIAVFFGVDLAKKKKNHFLNLPAFSIKTQKKFTRGTSYNTTTQTMPSGLIKAS